MYTLKVYCINMFDDQDPYFWIFFDEVKYHLNTLMHKHNS